MLDPNDSIELIEVGLDKRKAWVDRLAVANVFFRGLMALLTVERGFTLLKRYFLRNLLGLILPWTGLKQFERAVTPRWDLHKASYTASPLLAKPYYTSRKSFDQ